MATVEDAMVTYVIDDHDHDHDHDHPMKIPSVWIRELIPGFLA